MSPADPAWKLAHCVPAPRVMHAVRLAYRLRASGEAAAPASEVRSTARPTRRGRNSIAPVAWWTAAGGAEASKRRLTSASLKQAEAVSIARVL